MLWYCRFTWYPGTTLARVRDRVVKQHAAKTNHPERILGWYNLAGGGAGFMLVEADDPADLNHMLEPYMDLMSWDVRAVYELPYNAVTAHLFPEELDERTWATAPFTSHSYVQGADGAPPIPPEEEAALEEIFRKAEAHAREQARR